MRLSICILIVLLSSCKGDALNDDYNAFEGTYIWYETGTKEQGILNNQHDSISPARAGYEASIVLDDQGQLLLYKNNTLLTENTYTVADKEINSGSLKIILKLKGNVGSLDISDKRLTLTLRNDTLTVDRFPFPAIDAANNYHEDHISLLNYFSRK